MFRQFLSHIFVPEKEKRSIFSELNCNISASKKSNIKTNEKQSKMKKAIYTIAMIFIGSGISMANTTTADHSGEDNKDSAKVAASEAPASVESSFTTMYSSDSRQLTVNVSGILDPYASVSVTNLRGATIKCSFIQEKSGEMSFDLSTLEKGTYNVMLITDQEIRIKRIQVG